MLETTRAIDPTTELKVEQLVSLWNLEEILAEAKTQFEELALSQLIQKEVETLKGKDIDQNLIDQFVSEGKEAVTSIATKEMKDLRKHYVAHIRASFTSKELDTLIKFYSDPVAKKVVGAQAGLRSIADTRSRAMENLAKTAIGRMSKAIAEFDSD